MSIKMITLFMVLFSSIGIAQVTETIGQCTNSTHIQYTTQVTVNGVTHTIESPVIECNIACVNGLGEFGDECAGSSTTSMELVAVWGIMWFVLIWFRQRWKYMGTPFLFFNALAGVLIIQHIILLLLIAATLVLWLWELGAIGKLSEWTRGK